MMRRVGSGDSRNASGASRKAALAVACALALASTGCPSDDDGGSAPDDPEPRASEPEASTASTTEPAATDPEVVVPYLEDLLDRYEQAVRTIIADPSLATDTDNEVVVEYVDLFEPDSDEAKRAVDGWAGDADEGRTFEPYDDDASLYTTRLDGEVTPAEGGDEVTFPTCDTLRYRVLDASGTVVDEVPEDVRQGQGVAVRVDGVWRLRSLDIAESAVGCRTEDEE